MQALQDEHFEHQDAAYGLASSLAFTFFCVNTFKDGAKYLPVDDGIESLQWISSLAQAGVAVLKVEEAVLHRTVVCFGSDHITFQTKLSMTVIQGNLIYRSALYIVHDTYSVIPAQAGIQLGKMPFV